MPTRAEPKHVGGRSRAAVLLVDVLQRFPGEEGAILHARGLEVVPALLGLRRAARAAGLPVIYLNDHEGRWRSSREELIARTGRGPRGEIARRLRPAAPHYLVLKPGRSGFHQSPLEALLGALGATSIVLAGVASDVCVLATASDAVMRKLRVHVPRDTSWTLDDARHDGALALMAATMAVDTRPYARLPVLRRPAR